MISSLSATVWILLASIFLTPTELLAAQEHSADSSSCELCLYGPDNIVFDVAGNAYITDSDHTSRFRVLKLSPQGKPIDEWHVFDEGQGQRKGPEGIAIDHDGNILVTDGGTLSVLKISPAGKILGRIRNGDEAFKDLGHIAIDSSGNIYVAEAAPNLIHKFSPAGTQVAVWQRTKGVGLDQWNGPETIAARTDGTLVVEDWGNHRIVVVSPSGQTLLAFGKLGTKPGEFAVSSGMGVDRVGNIYVTDHRLHRLQKFDASGRLLAAFPKDGSVPLFTEGPEGVTVDKDGNMYSVDGLTVVKLSPNGELLERWR
jgi:tripartite motif-containing protein 71